MDHWIKGLERHSNGSLTEQDKTTLVARFTIIAIFKAVFAPHSPLTANIPTHGNFDLMYCLIQQLNIAEVAFFSRTGNRDFLTSSGSLPVENGSAKKNNDE